MIEVADSAPHASKGGFKGVSVAHLSWALGAFMTSVLVNFVGLLHMRFMTDSLAIGALIAGALVSASKIYDAVFDTVMGALSDRTVSRWGPRRPYLLAGSFLCAGSVLMLFVAPAIGGPALVAYVGLSLMVYSTAYTLFRIPYLAMVADLTKTFSQRSTLIIWSVWGSSAGSLAATTLAPLLLASFGSTRAGHGYVAMIMALFILAGGLGCFALTASTANVAKSAHRRASLTTSLRALRDNPPFVALIGYKVVLFTGLTLQGVTAPYFTRYALHLSDRWLGWMFLLQTLFMVASQPLWRFLAQRFGRRRTAAIATLAAAVVFGAWLITGLVSDVRLLILALGAAQGCVTGGLFFSIQTMLPDTMEYDRHITGLSREGVFAGVFVMVEKLTNAAAIGIFGALMGSLGYLSSAGHQVVQPPSAVLGLYLTMAGLPVLMALVSVGLLRWYRLDEPRLKALRIAQGAAA